MDLILYVEPLTNVSCIKMIIIALCLVIMIAIIIMKIFERKIPFIRRQSGGYKYYYEINIHKIIKFSGDGEPPKFIGFNRNHHRPRHYIKGRKPKITQLKH